MMKCNIITYGGGPGGRGSPWSPCTPQRLVQPVILHLQRAEVRENRWILFCRMRRHFPAVLLREKKVKRRLKNGGNGGKIIRSHFLLRRSDVLMSKVSSLTSDLRTRPALHSARMSPLHKAARQPAELHLSTPWSQTQSHDQDSMMLIHLL